MAVFFAIFDKTIRHYICDMTLEPLKNHVMRYILALLSALSLLSTGCAVVRVSSTPVQTSSAIYATSADYTLERQLDLQAVVAAFAQSSNVEEFEYRINNSYNVVSNLDLNRDGYIDYLRVLETREGRSHVFLIQAVLGNSYFQDVATLIVDNPYINNYIYNDKQIVLSSD